MIHILSKRIVTNWKQKNALSADNEEIIQYGLELLFSTLFGISLILTIGIFFSKIGHALTFLVVFILLRRKCGGYHSSTYLGCNLLLLIVYLAVCFFESIIITPTICSLLLFVFSLVIVTKKCPVVHKNKPLNNSEKKLNKKRAILILLVLLLFVLATDNTPLKPIGNTITYTVVSVIVLVIV